MQIDTMRPDVTRSHRRKIVSQIRETVLAVRAGKAAALCLAMSAALVFPPRAAADAVTDWNVNAGKAALAACIEPPGSNDPAHESRMYAMMHVAIHDALNAIDRRFRPYVFNVQGPTGASREAAVASAARNVLVPVISQLPFSAACVQAGIASVEADYSAAIAALPNNCGQNARHSGRTVFGRRHCCLAGRGWFR